MCELVDFERLNTRQTRLTVGAVNVRTGKMHYFDSRNLHITLDHVLASGALPPGFPAVRIDGDPYWDGGLYSNTPIEVVFDDNPRHDSVVFSVQIFPIAGPEPESVWQVMSRQIDIQYASRADSHIPRQEHIHQLRHMVRELVRMLPEEKRNTPEVKEMAGYGCGTLMHIIRINATPKGNEDYLREIDSPPKAFSGAGAPATPTRYAASPASRGRCRSIRWSACRSMIPTHPIRGPLFKRRCDS